MPARQATEPQIPIWPEGKPAFYKAKEKSRNSHRAGQEVSCYLGISQYFSVMAIWRPLLDCLIKSCQATVSVKKPQQSKQEFLVCVLSKLQTTAVLTPTPCNLGFLQQAGTGPCPMAELQMEAQSQVLVKRTCPMRAVLLHYDNAHLNGAGTQRMLTGLANQRCS